MSRSIHGERLTFCALNLQIQDGQEALRGHSSPVDAEVCNVSMLLGWALQWCVCISGTSESRHLGIVACCPHMYYRRLGCRTMHDTSAALGCYRTCGQPWKG